MYKSFFSPWKCVSNQHTYINAPLGPLATVTGYVRKGFLKWFQTDFDEPNTFLYIDKHQSVRALRL